MFGRGLFSVSAGVLLGLIFSASASAQSDSAGLKVITRGTVSTTAVEWADIIARRKLFYEKEGLKVEQALISPTTITPSLIGGTIQIGFINASQLILADKAGADLVAIGKGGDPSAYSLVTGKSIHTLADLKGKTISLAEPGDAYTEATKEILRKAGLDTDKDINFRYGGNSNQRMAALIAGAVDGVPLVPPQDQQAISQGFNSVAFYPDYFPQLTLSVSAVSRAWAMQNEDIIRSYLKAQAEAIAWLYDPKNKDEADKLLMIETKSDEKSASDAYDLYLHKLKMFALDDCVEKTHIQSLIALLSKVNKVVSPDESADKYIDTRWCPKL